MEELHTFKVACGIHGNPARCFEEHTKVIGFRWDLGDASCLAKPGTAPQSYPGFGGLLPMAERHSLKLLVAYTATQSDAEQQKTDRAGIEPSG
jgi:hypothetical protein